jgi:putative acetyltransferase
MQIRLDDLTGPEIAALLEAHLATMRQWSPPESIHALDLKRLRVPQITFWTIWDGGDLLGCGALKEIDKGHGEIKSMHIAAAHRRRGVGAKLLAHMIGHAKSRGYRRLSLETGSMAPFTAARRLYESFGFTRCEAFGEYKPDPNSAFMKMALE